MRCLRQACRNAKSVCRRDRNQEALRRGAAAERWHRALPKDVRPLVYLMDSAEERKVYKKPLGFLEEAEKIDRLNPSVRRPRQDEAEPEDEEPASLCTAD